MALRSFISTLVKLKILDETVSTCHHAIYRVLINLLPYLQQKALFCWFTHDGTLIYGCLLRDYSIQLSVCAV